MKEGDVSELNEMPGTVSGSKPFAKKFLSKYKILPYIRDRIILLFIVFFTYVYIIVFSYV